MAKDKVKFLSRFPGYTIHLEEKETLRAGNRVKRELVKVAFVGGIFETDNEGLIAALREVDGVNTDFHEVTGSDKAVVAAAQKNQAGQGAGKA